MIWTDDIDLDDNSFRIIVGGNGDYYLQIRYKQHDGNYMIPSVRLRTHGSSLPTSVLVAVSNLWREMEKYGLNEFSSEIEFHNKYMKPITEVPLDSPTNKGDKL
jgi:hypothetical protein